MAYRKVKCRVFGSERFVFKLNIYYFCKKFSLWKKQKF